MIIDMEVERVNRMSKIDATRYFIDETIRLERHNIKLELDNFWLKVGLAFTTTAAIVAVGILSQV